MRTVIEISCFHELDYQQTDTYMHHWIAGRLERVVPEPFSAWPLHQFDGIHAEGYHPRAYLETIGGDDIRSIGAERARWGKVYPDCNTEEEENRYA